MVKKIPDGFNSVSVGLTVPDGNAAIAFYSKAFGAEEVCRLLGPGGKGVMHAELRIGNSTVMLGDEMPGMSQSPKTLGGTATTICIYCEDADKVYNRAVAAGCTVLWPINDAFWGDRYGTVVDPFGHRWSIATHVKDLSQEQIEKAAEEWFKNACKPQ